MSSVDVFVIVVPGSLSLLAWAKLYLAWRKLRVDEKRLAMDERAEKANKRRRR
jgi:hypothetical protein